MKPKQVSQVFVTSHQRHTLREQVRLHVSLKYQALSFQASCLRPFCSAPRASCCMQPVLLSTADVYPSRGLYLYSPQVQKTRIATMSTFDREVASAQTNILMQRKNSSCGRCRPLDQALKTSIYKRKQLPSSVLCPGLPSVVTLVCTYSVLH